MSDSTPSPAPRRILHLVVEGSAPPPADTAAPEDATTEIFILTESNAREALDKIFAADSVSVWGSISG